MLTKRVWIRSIIAVGLATFLPLFYYLAVVGGLLPFFGIAIIAIRNLETSSILWFSLVHLAIYGVALYGVAALVARWIIRVAADYAWTATAVVLLLLSGIGSVPMYGIAHGHIRWMNAYALYASDTLR